MVRHAVVGDRQARPCNRSTRLAEPARPATGEPSRASAAGRARQSSRSFTTEPFQASNTNRHVIGAACAAVLGATATAAAHAQSSVALHGLLDASSVHEQSIGQAHVAARPRPAVAHGVRPERQRRAGRSASRRPTCRAHRRRIRKSRRRSPSGIGSDGAFRRRAANATERPARELGVPPPRAKAHWRARPVVECAPPLPG